MGGARADIRRGWRGGKGAFRFFGRLRACPAGSPPCNPLHATPMSSVVSPPTAPAPKTGGRSRRWTGPRVLDRVLAGWTAAVFVFLYLPIFVLVAYSFNTSKLNIV